MCLYIFPCVKKYKICLPTYSHTIFVKIKYFINIYLGSSVFTIFLKAGDNTILNGLMSHTVCSAVLLVHSI